MNILLGENIVAEGFDPTDPPPVCLLHDWIRESGSALTAQALREQLKSGSEVTLIPGHILRWSTENENTPE